MESLVFLCPAEKTGKDRKRQEKTGKRFEVRGDAEEPSDRELEKFPFRLKELRTSACFPQLEYITYCVLY